MATTSPDNIWTPDAGDAYALTTDLAAMADTVQDALVSVRADSGYQIGLDAARTALTAALGKREGLRWYSTDTDRVWLSPDAVTGNWLSSDPGCYLLRTVSLSGGAIPIAVDGVFTPRFSRYTISFDITHGSIGASIQLRSGGTPATGANYGYTYMWNNGLAPAITNDAASPGVNLSVNAATRHYGEIEVSYPESAVQTVFNVETAQAAGASSNWFLRGGARHSLSTAYDGFQIISTTGTPGAVTGFVSVYGWA